VIARIAREEKPNQNNESTDAKMSLRLFDQSIDRVIQNQEATPKQVSFDPSAQLRVNSMTTLDDA